MSCDLQGTLVQHRQVKNYFRILLWNICIYLPSRQDEATVLSAGHFVIKV